MSDEPTTNPKVRCAKNGPYIIEGLSQLDGPGGNPIATKGTTALCRCGKTGQRPFCDGTHAKVGFQDEKDADRVPDRRDIYTGKEITIFDNRGICSHAGYCSDNLKEVFRAGTEPWVDPDGAKAERIAEVIRMCPSGALSYAIDGAEHRDLERAARIGVQSHGPYLLEGDIEFVGVDSLQEVSTEHRTLCRCGQSKNKPFCDGTHWYANFRDDKRYRIAMLGDLDGGQWTPVTAEGVSLEVTRRGDSAAARVKGSMQELTTSVDPRWGEVLIVLDELHGAAPIAESVGTDAIPGLGNEVEPHVNFIRELATHGLKRMGSHGPLAAMGVPRATLPQWDDLQILTAQLHKLPQLEESEVGTELIVGPGAKKPLSLEIPLIVSDMSFGALSQEAKVALAKGAELAGTGICSGEGGMLPEEQAANSRYFYELASARFGFSADQLTKVQAFHFKGGQGAKTGTGGHLPGEKVTEKIAEVRGLAVGQPAISPPRFQEWSGIADFRDFANEVRSQTGGIPIGFKLSAQHIEKDIDAALDVGVDYIILDGRGGGTGAAPLLFRDNISVPTIPALARARRHLDKVGAGDVTLLITGGLRTPADFVKALALGADGIALANAAIQAIGCLGSRQCHTNTCPAGIATQHPSLRALIDVEREANNLSRFLESAVHLMSTLARACGHTNLNQFSAEDLTTWSQQMSDLTGVAFGGVGKRADL